MEILGEVSQEFYDKVIKNSTETKAVENGISISDRDKIIKSLDTKAKEN